MRRTSSATAATAGVTRARLAVEEDLGWLFREQSTEDYGIDAHAELVADDDVSGRLLALQIKSGRSWFREPGPAGWWYRPGAAWFDRTTFTGDAWFRRATFTSDGSFKGVKFSRTASFEDVTFAAKASFRKACFADEVTFTNATFAGAREFDGASFARGRPFD
jgi:hypothetical protein